jgi:hypothetical protein
MPSSSARNLFSKNNRRAVLTDELIERGPEMSLVLVALLLACAAEGLAGTRCCPDGTAPSGELQGKGPSADACEEVTLFVACKLIWSDIDD